MDQYYIIYNGQQVGPMSAQQLTMYGLSSDSKVWKQGLPNWVEAYTIPELMQVISAQNNAQAPQPNNFPQQPTYGPQQSTYGPQQVFGQGNNTKPDNYLVWSILVTIFCCLPFGIVAIVYSSKVDTLWAQGNYSAAQDASLKAKNWCIASAVTSVAVGFLYILSIGALL